MARQTERDHPLSWVSSEQNFHPEICCLQPGEEHFFAYDHVRVMRRSPFEYHPEPNTALHHELILYYGLMWLVQNHFVQATLLYNRGKQRPLLHLILSLIHI